jgi:hypothetical protein
MDQCASGTAKANRRSVSPSPFKGAHFATFPPKLKAKGHPTAEQLRRVQKLNLTLQRAGFEGPPKNIGKNRTFPLESYRMAVM